MMFPGLLLAASGLQPARPFVLLLALILPAGLTTMALTDVWLCALSITKAAAIDEAAAEQRRRERCALLIRMGGLVVYVLLVGAAWHQVTRGAWSPSVLFGAGSGGYMAIKLVLGTWADVFVRTPGSSTAPATTA